MFCESRLISGVLSGKGASDSRSIYSSARTRPFVEKAVRWFNKVSRGDWKIETDLILSDRTPDIICKFAYGPRDCIVPLAANRTGTLRYLLRTVLNDFKGSETEVRGILAIYP